MWMHELRLEDASRVHAYKHVVTRRYLHLLEGGEALDYVGDGRYRRVRLASAIARSFLGWERSNPCDEEVQALRKVIERARQSADATVKPFLEFQ